MPNPIILLSILDPRGRCNRRGLIVVALGLLVVQIAAALVLWLEPALLTHPAMLAFKVLLLVAAISAAAQRLHDIGRSAWWIPGALIALFAFGLGVTWITLQWLPLEAIQPGGRGFAIITAAITLPMLAALMWLHCAPGEPRANRYGPVPDGLGFARRNSRPAAPIGETAAAPV